MTKKVVCILISVFILNIFTPFLMNASAQSISDLQRELNEIKEEQQAINQESSDAKQKMKDNEARQAEVQRKIEALDTELIITAEKLEVKQNEIATTEAEIKEVETLIAQTEAEIEATEQEIIELEAEIDALIIQIEERNALIRERLRSMQRIGGQGSYLQLIFSAQNFSDFISRLTAVSKILDSDKMIMDAQQHDQDLLEAKVVEVEGKKAGLIEQKDVLTESHVVLEEKKQVLVDQRLELAELQEALNLQRLNQSNLHAELVEEYEELEEYSVSLADQQEIKRNAANALQQAIRAAEEEERQKKQEAEHLSRSQTARAGSGSGVLEWPAASRRITSPHGWRIHPITNVRTWHRGIDIGVPTPGVTNTVVDIYAAEAGVVSGIYREFDGRMNGYGDAIMITHFIDLNGNGQRQEVTTLYSHLQAGSTLVSRGQTVSRGQKIANMGNTGNSTGKHLDFEVHVGSWTTGRGVDPMLYLR